MECKTVGLTRDSAKIKYQLLKRFSNRSPVKTDLTLLTVLAVLTILTLYLQLTQLTSFDQFIDIIDWD